MKLLKKVNRYCPKCKKHTPHTISLAKKKERGTMKHGSIQRAMKRGLGRGFGNLGRWGSKPSKTKMGGKKSSKKQDLRFACSICKKTFVPRKTFRAKKLELKDERNK